MDEKIWAVCLYIEGGPNDGDHVIEFVRATDREHAEAQAINLNETGDEDGFQVNAAAELPADL